MYLELDPGTQERRRAARGRARRVANTLPDVNPDEILAQLDADTRAYLQILLNAGGGPSTTRSRAPTQRYDQTAAQDLRETFKRFEPTARDGETITACSSSAARTSGA